MQLLHRDHLGAEEYLLNGGFSVQIGSENPFGRIPVDQAVEETVNKDTQTPGGTKGFSLKQSTLARYDLTSEFRISFLRYLREIVSHKDCCSKHHDLQAPRMEKDENAVRSVVELLEKNWIYPFSGETQDLVSLSTGRLAPDEVIRDLTTAFEKGDSAYQLFKSERLSAAPIKQFHDRLPKQNLKTFSS